MKARVFRSSAILWVNTFTTGLMYFSISSLSSLIGSDLGFSDAQLSVLFSLPTFSYIVTGWAPGIIVDKLGKQKSVILVFSLLWLPSLLKLFTGSYIFFVIFTILQSIGILLSAPANSKAIKELNIPNFGKVLGIVNTGMSIGTWCTHTFALKLADYTGSWKGATLIFLFATLFLGTVSLFFLLTLPKSLETESAPSPKGKHSIFSTDQRHRSILAGISALYFGALATSFALNNWLPKLLTYGGFSLSDSVLSASAFAFGSLLSTVLVPLLFTSALYNAVFSIVAALFTIVFLAAVPLFQIPCAVLALSLALGILSGFLQIMVQYQIVENCAPEQAGQYSAFVFFIGNIGATVSILGVGMIPGSMYIGKILFIALFSLVSVFGGILLLHAKSSVRK